jgi:hypothetical protein
MAARLGFSLVAAAVLPLTGALAQSGAPTGSELAGHSVQVDSAGTVNTVYFDQGGTARIVGTGGQEVAANWAVQNGNICLSASSARECWPYQAAFQAGQPVDLVSDCGAATRWTPVSTAQPAPPPVQTQRAGERG